MAFNYIDHKQIRAAWKQLLATVTTDNGYINNISPDSIFDGAQDPTQGSHGDKHLDSYPMVSIDLEAEDYTYGVSGQIVKNSVWLIGIAVVADPDDASPTALLEAQDNAIKDIETLIMNNSALSGLARQTRILQLYCDTGMNPYEGICLFRVMVEYSTRANIT